MDRVTIGGKTMEVDKLLSPWQRRRDAAKRDRKRYEPQWMTSQHFAAGKQHVAYIPREHRMLLPMLATGRSRQTADVLNQYISTVVGKLAADDFRPQMLFAHDDAQGEDFADMVNKALDFGWEREWHGDAAILDLLRKLAVFGTAAIRCRFDKGRGKEIAGVPHRDGKPILEPDEARAYVADKQFYGESADLRTMREGKVVWEVLSPYNLLPPPGVEHPEDFPWEIVVRPVHVDLLKGQYGEKAEGIKAEAIESMDVLGLGEGGGHEGGTLSESPGKAGGLEEHALVYTGYLHPTPDWPKGQTVVFAGDSTLLDSYGELPYGETSAKAARSGISYFRYWTVPQRFWGRGLIEPGIGPQRIRNKRLAQIDEIIDRGLPKVYVEEGALVHKPKGLALEVIELKSQSSKPETDGGIAPGAWMAADIELQDANIEKALGIRGVSLGENPSGVDTYSQLVLLRENDADKIDPIAAEIKLGIAELTYDSIEAMRNWPPDKMLMIAGEDDTLEVFTFGNVKLPAEYMVKPAKGGTQLRSQGAELQKITDIWNAAMAVRQPLPLSWYVESLEAGKAQEIPDTMGDEQRHKAALENLALAAGQDVPVAEYDDHAVHAEEHTEEQLEWQQLAVQGHPNAEAIVQAFQRHKESHLEQAQANAATAPPPPQPGLPAAPVAPNPGGAV